jgi:ring-1,2-phenylacetyl-CoA epoxidase subunit PaaD
MACAKEGKPGMQTLNEDKVWHLLYQVKDPEIPVVSVVEMGMIREVEVNGDQIQVTMTPTFIGCPAVQVMQAEIKSKLEGAGARKVRVNISHNPPWSSDWIRPEARQKLKEFGLAPPPRHNGNFEAVLLEAVKCPYCGSSDTSLKNGFGSTLCRAIFYCNNCQQPFEQFKPI